MAVVSWFLRAIKDRDFGVTGLDKRVFVRLELLLSKVGVPAAVLVVVFTEDSILHSKPVNVSPNTSFARGMVPQELSWGCAVTQERPGHGEGVSDRHRDCGELSCHCEFMCGVLAAHHKCGSVFSSIFSFSG